MTDQSAIFGCGRCAHIRYMGNHSLARCEHPKRPPVHAVTARTWGHCGTKMGSFDPFIEAVPDIHSIPRIGGQQ